MNAPQVLCPCCKRVLVIDKEIIAPFVIRIAGVLQCTRCKVPITLEEIYSGVMDSK